MANINLSSAKKAKNDEFYTQYSDIQKEIEAYLEYDPDTFRGKVVYSNCDDPFESNFFRYFALNFNRLGLKQLITTSYQLSPIASTPLGQFGDDKTIVEPKGRARVTASKFIINEVHDMDGDGVFNLADVAEQLKANKNNEWAPLEGDGDFRSAECVKLLKQSDVIVTNPPFSLFREYIKQLFDYNKKFLIIGNMNAITYKEVFPLIKDNKVWLGNNAKVNGGAMFYEIPEAVANLDQVREIMTRQDGRKVFITRVQGVRWFTNLDHGRLHQPIQLMTEDDVIKFSTQKPFEHYDNYNAIEVSLVKNIPSDYLGVMGVPISFLDKYSPEQFEILGITDRDNLHGMRTKVYTREDSPKYSDLNRRGAIKVGNEYKPTYVRLLVKHRKEKK